MRTVTIQIRRPEGHIESVDVSKNYTNMNDTMFANIRKATMAAGRGYPLSYKVEEEALTAEEAAEIKAYDDKARFFARHGFNASDV